jgi:hypothetical protein
VAPDDEERDRQEEQNVRRTVRREKTRHEAEARESARRAPVRHEEEKTRREEKLSRAVLPERLARDREGGGSERIGRCQEEREARARQTQEHEEENGRRARGHDGGDELLHEYARDFGVAAARDPDGRRNVERRDEERGHDGIVRNPRPRSRALDRIRDGGRDPLQLLESEAVA